MNDYYYQNITRNLDHPRLARIMDLVDPYSEIPRALCQQGDLSLISLSQCFVPSE